MGGLMTFTQVIQHYNIDGQVKPNLKEYTYKHYASNFVL